VPEGTLFRVEVNDEEASREARTCARGVTADFEGHPRPRGKAFDVGANEFLPRKAAPARGPLRAHPRNPRYFTDGSGKPVYLTGSHHWDNLQDGDNLGRWSQSRGPSERSSGKEKPSGSRRPER
jgi:hypothetical protein